MPDEVGTEASRPDSVSVDDSLFGDIANDAGAEAVEEEDSKSEKPQDPQGSNDAENEDGAAEELKVVVSVKGGRATIGVQRPSADPHIESFDDPDLSGLAQEIPAVAERAKARWEDEPKYPAHEKPAPPARRRNRRQQESAQTPTAETEEEADQEDIGAPRLF